LSFIITLTGPSASGKSYVIDKINDVANEVSNFNPESFPKFTTREYRTEEIIKRQEGGYIDVKQVNEIPKFCDLVYRTYGKEYGLRTDDLKQKLQNKITPIVIINDVRAVEELKKKFYGKVLSLFLFRQVPSFMESKIGALKRGNVSEEEVLQRYLKATSLYRVYIENITVFNRVVLNVRDYGGETNEIDFTKKQIENIIRGVLNKQISLTKKIIREPKLFIISGNSASGKDDIIQAVRKMGRLQASIIPKYTSRMQEFDDEDEMICQYIPKKALIDQYKKEYQKERDEIINRFAKKPTTMFIAECRKKYIEEKETGDFKSFYKLAWSLAGMKSLKQINRPLSRFWKYHKDKKDSFQKNHQYINLVRLKEQSLIYNKKQISDELCYTVKDNRNIDFIYVNHGKNKSGINYGFSTSNLLSAMEEDKKHRVLVASFVNIFEFCKEKIGKEKVVSVFSYSQISKEDFEASAESESVKLQKSISFNNYLLKYAENIVDFDHVIIYAETQMHNTSGAQKEEIIDQMFRLFRAYNEF